MYFHNGRNICRDGIHRIYYECWPHITRKDSDDGSYRTDYSYCRQCFLHKSSGFDLIISYIESVGIFVGLTAYDSPKDQADADAMRRYEGAQN